MSYQLAFIGEAVSRRTQEREAHPNKLPELVARFLADIRTLEKSRCYILDMQARLHEAAVAFKGESSAASPRRRNTRDAAR